MRSALIRWLVIGTVACYLIVEGLVGTPLGKFGDVSASCPDEPVTLVSVAHGAGEKVAAVGDASPAEVRAWWSETFKMLGVAAGSFRLGALGQEPPEKLATWEAQAVAAAYEECEPVDEGPILVADAPRTYSGNEWGGHQNGRIPAPSLCPVRGGGMARCDAAAAFDRMTAAYEEEFGTLISVTDTYRDYAGQVSCRQRKGNLCAKPGTSNHGWGVAFDLGGGIQRFGTPQHEWMRANAAAFGFTHPVWAQAGGSKPEPWHWEFIGGAVAAG